MARTFTSFIIVFLLFAVHFVTATRCLPKHKSGCLFAELDPPHQGFAMMGEDWDETKTLCKLVEKSGFQLFHTPKEQRKQARCGWRSVATSSFGQVFVKDHSDSVGVPFTFDKGAKSASESSVKQSSQIEPLQELEFNEEASNATIERAVSILLNYNPPMTVGRWINKNTFVFIILILLGVYLLALAPCFYAGRAILERIRLREEEKASRDIEMDDFSFKKAHLGPCYTPPKPLKDHDGYTSEAWPSEKKVWCGKLQDWDVSSIRNGELYDIPAPKPAYTF